MVATRTADRPHGSGSCDAPQRAAERRPTGTEDRRQSQGGGGASYARRPAGTDGSSTGGAAGHPCGARAAAERPCWPAGTGWGVGRGSGLLYSLFPRPACRRKEKAEKELQQAKRLRKAMRDAGFPHYPWLPSDDGTHWYNTETDETRLYPSVLVFWGKEEKEKEEGRRRRPSPLPSDPPPVCGHGDVGKGPAFARRRLVVVDVSVNMYDKFQQSPIYSGRCLPSISSTKWWTFPVMRAETCTHSANCAEDRRDPTRAVLGLYVLVVVQRQVRGRGCAENCSWTVPPPGIGGVSFGPSPNLDTKHTIYELCLPIERGLGMSMDFQTPAAAVCRQCLCHPCRVAEADHHEVDRPVDHADSAVAVH